MRIWPILLVVAAVSAGCNNSSNTTAPADTGGIASFDYGGTLQPQGSLFTPVPISADGSLSIKLMSLTTGPFDTSALPQGMQITLGVGDLSTDQTMCTVTLSANVSPGFTNQIAVPAQKSTTRCVQVSDPGTLTVPVNYVVRIDHT